MHKNQQISNYLYNVTYNDVQNSRKLAFLSYHFILLASFHALYCEILTKNSEFKKSN